MLKCTDLNAGFTLAMNPSQEYIALVVLNLNAWKNMARYKKLIIVMACSFLLGCLPSPAKKITPSFEQPETGVYGLVTAGREVESSVWVYAYRSQDNGFRGPADFAARVNEDGSYLLDLLPGRWFLVARSRLEGPLTGPPQTGDSWAIYQQNPLVLQADEVQRVDLKLLPVAPTLLLRGGSLSTGETGFSGRLLGPDSKPVVGAIALAYRDLDFQRMPDHSSAAVAADGKFMLYVTVPGQYCLLARQGTRGQPRQGELFGLLGAGAEGCRELKKGDVLEVGDIHLSPYLR